MNIFSTLLPTCFCFFITQVIGQLSESQFQLENCTSPSSKWENLHYCIIATLPQKYQKACMPKRLYPTLNGAGKVKGLIVMYHGFTACPDAFNEISKVMVDQGFVVLIPLLPGMGVNRGYNCNSAPDQCLSHGMNPSDIPTSKEEYFSWSQNVIDITHEEASFISPDIRDENFKVVALGLNVGGSLAIYAAELEKSPFEKIMAVNPYFSTGNGQLDFFVYQCTLINAPHSCITSLLNSSLQNPIDGNLVENGSDSSMSVPLYPIINASNTVTRDLTVWSVKNRVGRILTESYEGFLNSVWKLLSAVGDSSSLASNNLFNDEISWGDWCTNNDARGGICAFRIRHLIALQSFVAYVVGNIDRIPTSIQYGNIHSDMDGASRDSVSFAVYNSLSSRGVPSSRCRFKYTCGINQIIQSQKKGDNLCGAPHSCFSSAEGRFTPPHELYWQQSLFDTVSSFFNSSAKLIGVGSGNMNMCIASRNKLEVGAPFDAIGTQYLEFTKHRYGVFVKSDIFSAGFQ